MSHADLVDAGRLIAYAARPKERPRPDDDYSRVVSRYLDDAEFASLCDAVAAGMGLDLVVDRAVGVIAIAESDSPFRMPLSEFMRRTNPPTRALLGVVVIAVARVAYPQPSDLDDPARVARVSTAAVAATIDRIVERLASDAEDPDADRPDDAEVWRAWEALRQARAHAQRASVAERSGLVRKVCGYLGDEGHLQQVNDDDGGTWRATPRFRLAVTAMVEDSDIYGAVLAAGGTP